VIAVGRKSEHLLGPAVTLFVVPVSTPSVAPVSTFGYALVPAVPPELVRSQPRSDRPVHPHVWHLFGMRHHSPLQGRVLKLLQRGAVSNHPLKCATDRVGPTGKLLG